MMYIYASAELVMSHQYLVSAGPGFGKDILYVI